MDTIGTIHQSKILTIERPDIAWMPLRKAPFHFQAVYSRLRNISRPPNPSLLSFELIDAAVEQMITDASIIKCEVDREEYGAGFLLSYDDWEPDPYDENGLSRTISHSFVEPFELPENLKRNQVQLAILITRAWNVMELRFRRALKAGHCRLLARCGAAYTPVFSELPSEIFVHYKVIDLRNGVAESIITPGDRLYEIHVEATSPPSCETSSSSKDLSQIVPDHIDTSDPLFAPANKSEEGSPSVVAAVSALLSGHGPRVLKVAQYFFCNPNAVPIGDVIPQSVKDELNRVLKSSFDPRTAKAGLKLARDLRILNPTRDVLMAYGFIKV